MLSATDDGKLCIKHLNESEKLLLFVSEQVGRLQCPLMLVVGEDDQNWPAHESAMDVSLLACEQVLVQRFKLSSVVK